MPLSLFSRVRSALGLITGWLRSSDREERLAEEIRFHMDMAAEKNRRLGMTTEASNHYLLSTV